MSKRKLEEIVNFNPSYSLKKGDIAPFIDMASLSAKDRNVYNITQKKFTGGGARFKNGDTLFARITPCLENGKTAKVSGLSENAVGFGSTEFIVLSAKNPLFDEDYIYYLARLPEFRQYAQTHMDGTSGRQRVSWQSLSEFSYPFPDEEIRKRSANILKIFDDKIELNTQTNQTLEQIAQSIFKSWFVDFDPVKAKMDVLAHGGTVEQAELQAMQIISGKTAEELEQMQRTNPEEYKTLAKITALFPSEMVENELGDIPKGWEVQQIKDIGFIVCGKTPSKQNPNFYGGDIPFIKIPDMHGNTFIIKTNEYLSKEGADSQKTKYLPKGSISVSCIATVGKVSIVTKPSQTNQQINSIIPNNDYLTEFLYFYMNELEDEFYSLASGGSATLNMNTRVFSSIKLLKPKDDLLTIYHSKVKPIFDMILSNQKENKNLAEIRDMLLPKLLSGEF